MDKRLLIVLPLCFAIVIGWGLLAEHLGWAPKPRPRTPPAVSAPAADADLPGAAAAGAVGDEAQPQLAPPPALAPRIGESEARELVLVAGRAGLPGHWRAVFSNRGAVLSELRSAGHAEVAGLSQEQRADWRHWAVLVAEPETGGAAVRALALRSAPASADLTRAPLDEALWRMQLLGTEQDPQGVEFTLAPGSGVTFVKRVLFVPGTWDLRLELELRNEALETPGGARSFVLTPAAGMPADSGDAFYSEPQAIAFSRARDGSKVLSPEPVDHEGGTRSGSLPVAGALSFAGVHNKYFAVLLRPADEAAGVTLIGASWRLSRDLGWLRAHPGQEQQAWRQIQTDIDLQLMLPPRGETRQAAYLVYAGPKQREALVAAYADHAQLIEYDLGFVSGIAKVLIAVMEFFHSLSGSWGVAIILLTLAVRLVLFPVNRRSQTAMARYQVKMKRLQPRIEELKQRWVKDPQRLRQEQARLMQQEGAFPPLGGCLPPLLQIPVFIGLFRAVGVHFDLRQADFLGLVSDLSLPDRLLPLEFTLPFLGHQPAINVLPPLMVVMWIWQQRSMPMPTEEQARMMYKMMMWMPVVMGIFLYNYAAGLSLYMITQSALGIVEMKIIRKHWPVDDTEQPRKPGGFMSRLMQAQETRAKALQQQRPRGSRGR